MNRRKKVPPNHRDAVFARDGTRCRYCGWMYGDVYPAAYRKTLRRQRPPFQTLEIDHVIPVIFGGTNDLANLQVLCTYCNTRKGVRDDAQVRPSSVDDLV